MMHLGEMPVCRRVSLRHRTQVTQRALMAVWLTAVGVFLGGCGERLTTDPLSGARLELIPESDSRSLILVDPHAATLEVNHGIIMRARVVDATGEVRVDARPIWRTTQPAVATTHVLPDSASAPGARVAVSGTAPGIALVIATYANLADTTVITVGVLGDTVGNTSPPSPPTATPRPTLFDATITVRGFVAGVDSASSGSLSVPGAMITLTLLPPIAGDSLPPGVSPVAAETVFGTLVVNSESRALFTSVPQSRFRIDVAPPVGSVWQEATFTSGPPQIGHYIRLVTLQKR